jgi:hypothetical protein
MTILLNYLGHELTDEWQLVCLEPVFKTALVLPPKGQSDAGSISGLISIPHCTVFVLVPGDCLVTGLRTYDVEPNGLPQYGLLNLLHRKLFTVPYKYGIVQRIT